MNKQINLKWNNQEIEDCREHLYFPLYFENYTGAIRNILFRMIQDKREEELRRGQFSYACEKDVSNILSFIGPRGSGKTTAMREFCEILKRMENSGERRWWLEQALPETEGQAQIKDRKFYFKILPLIDASRLEEKEDLFNIIIANIYHEYEKTESERPDDFYSLNYYEEKEIHRIFEEIVENYHAIKNARKEDFGDSVIAKMKYMSGSMDIREKIDVLIKRLLLRWGGADTASFLVIILDDLDLNIAGGYEMLNQLYKYFSNQHIIIAIAVDDDQMNRICEMHYLKEFMQNSGAADIDPERDVDLRLHCKKLSRDYLLKMLPMSNRFFMPDVENTNRSLVVYNDNRENPVVNCPEESIKHHIMKKTARYMKIYYDSVGVKTHFCEPSSVREIVSYDQFLETLYEVNIEHCKIISNKEKGKQLAYYDVNHEKFNFDIMRRMTRSYLNERYRELFIELHSKELARRAMYFCQMAESRVENGISGLEQPKEYYNQKYSYFLLLEYIYKLGRVSDEDKGFIKCLLASFSSEMVREYIHSRYDVNPETQKSAFNRLNGFLGKTVGGNWAAEMVPKLEGKYEVGYNDKVDLTWFQIDFLFGQEEIWQDISEWSSLDNVDEAEYRLGRFSSWLEEQRVIPVLECIAVFFHAYDSGGDVLKNIDFKMHFGRQAGKGSETYLIVSSTSGRACLDIFGFVKETLNYRENYKSMQCAIAGALTKAVLEELEIWTEQTIPEEDKGYLETVIYRMVEGQSIHKKRGWKYEGEVAFPFYNIDLSYNIIKRVHRDMNSTGSISKEECYEYIRKVYLEILRHLKEQAQFYKDVQYQYDKIMESCPYIKTFLQYDKYLRADFPQIFGDCIFSVERLLQFEAPDFPDVE